MEGARFYAEKGIFPGGAYDNFEYYQDHVQFSGELQDWEKMLLFDPQTSGGLLAAVDEEQYLKYLSTNDADPLFWKIGEIIPKSKSRSPKKFELDFIKILYNRYFAYKKPLFIYKMVKF